ncbi:MAG: FMN-binding protein [Clostridiales bacterium]|nr:FMN-binding protein [Clostridiales bacterium]
MKKRIIAAVFTIMLALPLLFGCKGNSRDAAYKDGAYVGKSGEDDQGAYGEVTLTIKDGEITACEFVTWQKDGTIKDENYGKVNDEISSQDYYDKAQLAVKAMRQYAQRLVEVQNAEDVDAISGATIAFDQFQEAVGEALENAKE